MNKSLPVLSGAVSFEYQVLEPRAPGWHVYFAMIPMQQSQRGLLEVGAEFPVDPANERSPFDEPDAATLLLRSVRAWGDRGPTGRRDLVRG